MTYAVVVFVDAGRGKTENIAQLAPPFFTAFQDVGKPSLPVVLIGTPTEDEVWVTVNGTELSDGKHKKALRQTAATVKLKADPYFASKTAVPPVKPGDKMLLWGKADGKGQYKGKFLALEGDNIRVANPAGEQGSVPLSDLNPAGIRYAKFIGGESAPESAAAPAEEKKPAAAVERWTNKDGKELQATFVSLANGKVTLRSAAGKDYVLPLESLSAVSQARAKELAAPAAKKDKP
jgi:hypothetical protein